MSNLKERAMMFSETQPDYVRDGLVLYLDAEEPFMIANISGNATRIWCDRAVAGQKAHMGGVSQSGSTTIWNSESSQARIPATEYISLLGILSGMQERTIEVVCKINDTENPQTVFLGCGSTTEDNFAAGLWYRPASGGFKVGTYSEQASVLVDNITDRASYSIVYGTTNINDFFFYQNGSYCPKGATGGNMNNNTYTTIGSRYYNGAYGYRLDGEINCIRVYNRKLSAAERKHNLDIDKRRFDIDAG